METDAEQAAPTEAPRGIPYFGNAFQIEPSRFHLQIEQWCREHGPLFKLQIGRRKILIVGDHAARSLRHPKRRHVRRTGAARAPVVHDGAGRPAHAPARSKVATELQAPETEDSSFRGPSSVALGWLGPSVEARVAVFVVDGGPLCAREPDRTGPSGGSSTGLP